VSATVLGVSTRALLDTCDRLGLDAEAIAARAGLDRRSLDDPDARIAGAMAENVWREALGASRDPGLALRAAEAVPPGAYRVLDYAAAASENLGEALRRVASYFGIVGRAHLEIETSGDVHTLVLSSAVQGRALPPPAEEYTLAAVLLRTRSATNVPWIPARVTFTFEPPEDTALHRRIFGVDPIFGAERATMAVAPSDWMQASAGADPNLAAILDEHARAVIAKLPASEDSFATRVAHAIASALSGGDPSLAAIAKALHTTERTLQRRLEDEGTSFASVVASERERAARGYLERREVAIAEVAWLLGFSDQSAFTRAFRRWTGMTPARYRQRALHAS
jgi:AraC-like DNA-binding protein